jgi:hypothetical protein
VKPEVNSTMILPPLVFPGFSITELYHRITESKAIRIS